ncbi:MAG: hypothetical protein P4L99_19195 [Chthoniobacter sp.]|nr:hypothetical protein [Chthoniobacter sp.]
MAPLRRFEWLLFLACFVAFAWFHQGGGWNQNSRFAEVRAIVEEGRFAIDDFLVYKVDPTDAAGRRFVRLPLKYAEYTWEGQVRALSWVDMAYELYPVNEDSRTPDAKNMPMIEECCSGDIGYVPWTGQFHPNKPPGTTFLAVPAYWLIYHFEKWRGLNPDEWWTLTVNAWLTSAFSVGLISAFGCVVFFRLARQMAGGKSLPALLATLAFAFGTTFFPFGTLLFDHDLTAVFLLMAFSCLWHVRGMERPSPTWVMLAGACSGIAAITNYIAAGAGAILALYALLATLSVPGKVRWNWRALGWFSVGVAPLFVVICVYDWVNFGSPFKLANDFQNPLFKDTSALLGMFYMPNPYVAGLLTVSPYRGIFFLAPVTIMGIYGLIVWLREKTWVAEARLCLAIFGFFFLVNVCFNGYHGGFSAGPRYLVPGLPFLGLPLVVAFMRWRWLTSALMLISIVQQTLLTATDAQNSLAVGGHARVDDAHRKDDFFCQIVGEYAWPLFAYGRAWPVLNQLIAARLDKEDTQLKDDGMSEPERKENLAKMEKDMRESIARGESTSFILGAIRGPVSVNPIGSYDGLLTFTMFPAGSVETDWNSFNAGEFFFPESRASLLPLLVISGGLAGLLIVLAGRRDRLSASGSNPLP